MVTCARVLLANTHTSHHNGFTSRARENVACPPPLNYDTRTALPMPKAAPPTQSMQTSVMNSKWHRRHITDNTNGVGHTEMKLCFELKRRGILTFYGARNHIWQPSRRAGEPFSLNPVRASLIWWRTRMQRDFFLVCVLFIAFCFGRAALDQYHPICHTFVLEIQYFYILYIL